MVPGPAGVKRANDRFLAAFTDIHLMIEDQIVEGESFQGSWAARA